ncbi:FixH family protein [Paenibacillus dokdonensis]|uniref:FixH family protein n=1 Tax=Paenibacillus dokdonensis TaxID=2567944 RepID=A0ABU6GII8_9BACL|nr:FixH family protein [Paenibacillus dokdonensis]MEC0239523.1 FixH family protein [Paenibacillus dokdonensis]
MKNRIWLTGVILLVILTLTGCGSKSEHNGMNMDEGMMEPLTVDLSWTPEQVKVGQKVSIEVNVAQKDNKVDKADEVMIEITKEGDSSNHEKVPAENAGAGKYVLEKTFDSDGTYSITSHVTYGPQHTMPTKKLTVSK